MLRSTCAYLFLKLWVILLGISYSCAVNLMGDECKKFKRVEIHHKKYFDIYLSNRHSSYTGIFYKMINDAVYTCCSSLPVQFIPIEDEDQSIEEILLNTVKANRGQNRNDSVLKLYFPEFADKTARAIYDSTTPFLRLSKSPGHAIVMVKPNPKEPVFIGEIVVKSWAILIFLVAFAWVVGILAWMSVGYLYSVL